MNQNDVETALEYARLTKRDHEVMNGFGLLARQLDLATKDVDGVTWDAIPNGESIQIIVGEFQDKNLCYALAGVLRLIRDDTDA